jgi:hypothetical protein
VDSTGRAQNFELVQGDRSKQSEALAAARRWSFAPCSGSGSCEHLLKVTCYGDVSRVQVIE